MPTIKLVVIGSSGVGKTSLRGQYISGRFSTGYRATIGADFITKTLPHPSNPDEPVMLQIWDTAGQERFSSLSTAFFRGADAAVLMFDVNVPETMDVLTKWWSEFCANAPVAEEEMEEFCCVVVGNKIDLPVGDELVTKTHAIAFLDQLVPRRSRSPSPVYDSPDAEVHNDSDTLPTEDNDDDPLASSQLTARPDRVQFPTLITTQQGRASSSASPRTRSIDILPMSTMDHSSPSSRSPKHHLPKSSSRSSSRFYGGTMTTTHTTLTIYHTPSSSLYDVYQSARSSPEPWSSPTSASSPSAAPSVRTRRLTSRSTGSTSTGSAVTITPSLFAREQAKANLSSAPPADDPFTASLPPPLAKGPKLFFTSAKTGSGVPEVFEYIARRVVRRWEYQERLEARRMHVREDTATETIRLGLQNGRRKDGSVVGSCCTS